MKDHTKLGIGTKAIHAGQPTDEFGSATPAIYQTSTFVFNSAAQGAARFKGEKEGYIYTRPGNPTNRMLEDNIAAMEGGCGALACSSGMPPSQRQWRFPMQPNTCWQGNGSGRFSPPG